MPKRIQRKRTKGWRMPEGAVYVGRPTIWGNPFPWIDWLDSARSLSRYLETAEDRELWAKEQATQEFADAIKDGEIVLDLAPLRGKDLVCWCAGPKWSCHADVLLELANA